MSNGILNHREMLNGAIADINQLMLQGALNWSKANSAINRISAVIEGLKKEEEARENAYKASIENAKQMRERKLKNGESVVGGETIRINADGTQEVLVP